jgi:hypothetical protein
MTKDEALRIALEALEKISRTQYHIETPPIESLEEKMRRIADQAITAIKAALQAKEEPWEKFCDSNCVWTDHHPDCKLAKDEPVATIDSLEQEIYENTRQFVSLDVMEWMLKRYYTTPPQRKPLTDEMLRKMHHEDQFGLFCDYDEFEQIARAIEAAHGIKGEA